MFLIFKLYHKSQKINILNCANIFYQFISGEALTKAHGIAESKIDGDKSHAAVQTDLADLLSGAWPDSIIVVPSNDTKTTKSSTNRPQGHVRTNSLRFSQEQAAALTAQLTYKGHDLSDVSSKGNFVPIFFNIYFQNRVNEIL